MVDSYYAMVEGSSPGVRTSPAESLRPNIFEYASQNDDVYVNP